MKKIILNISIALVAAVAAAQSETPLKPIKEVFAPKPPADVSKYMKIAVIQWNPYSDAPVGASKADIKAYLDNNRSIMKSKIEQAVSNGAQFIVMSEFAVVGYPDIPELPSEEDEFRNRDDIKDFVDTIPGDSTGYFSDVAKKNKVWIQFGMAEVETKTDKYFNTAVVINDKGQIVASFRKNSLYQLENHFLSAGDKAITFESPMGKVGLLICADVYNSTLLAKYAAAKVDVLSLSTSWAQMNTGMNSFVSTARQMKTYLLAANQTYFPDSGVINPDGSTQSHIRQSRDAIAYGYVPLKAKMTRQNLKLRQRPFMSSVK